MSSDDAARLKLRRQRERFLSGFTRLLGLKPIYRAHAVRTLTSALDFGKPTTTWNVILGHRNCSPEAVEALKHFVRSRKRKRGSPKLNFSCLLNSDKYRRGKSRRRKRLDPTTTQSPPRPGRMIVNIANQPLLMRVTCSGSSGQSMVLHNLRKVSVSFMPASD